jgi:protein TonB
MIPSPLPLSRFVRPALRLLPLALLLAACAQKTPSSQPQPPLVAMPPPVAEVPAPASTANNLGSYKIEVAKRVYEANAERVFTGKPPPLLRSIVVLSVVVDERGEIIGTRIFRDNGDLETRAAALASLKRAMPLPRPTRAVLRRGQVEYLESWLFRRDGKFQMRTLAEIQASE